jgi:hypothetical protein
VRLFFVRYTLLEPRAIHFIPAFTFVQRAFEPLRSSFEQLG